MHTNYFKGCLALLLIVLTACNTPTKQAITPSSAPPIPATISPSSPTSDELVDAAADSGQINHEIALTYKVFALFQDPRLPAQFAGNTGLSHESHVLDYLEVEFTSLSPETQAILLPFLMPPAYKGSWADPNLDKVPKAQQDENASRYPSQGLPCNEINDQWDSKAAMHAPVRFWWDKSRPDDEQVVNMMMTAMDDDIWTKLTTLMGRVPKADGDTRCSGGGPELDVYLSAMVKGAVTPSASPPGCRETPSFIIINPKESRGTLAHEFMHAIQWAYPVANGCMYPGDYAWLAEATATWAEDYVYPSSNTEQIFVDSFYNPSSEPTLPLYEPKGYHQYGTYLYFYYLARHFGQPEIISRAWGNTTSSKSVEAVDLAIPGGYADTWADFAIYNLVEPPQDDYQQWDNLNIKPSGKSQDEFEAEGGNEYMLTGVLPPLSIHYDKFTFKGDATLVTFLNGMSYSMDEQAMESDMVGNITINDGTTKNTFTHRDDVDGLKIQAYYKVAGDTDWQLEDWTDKETMSFCRDVSEERLTDLVIVYSNSSMDKEFRAKGLFPQLSVSKTGCWRYSGNASLEMSGDSENGSFEDIQTVSDITFERTDTHPNIPYPILRFQVIGGQVERTYRFIGEKCSGSGEKSSPLEARNKYELYILYGAVDGDSKDRYGGTSNVDQSVTVKFTCENPVPPMDIPSFPWFFTDGLSSSLLKVYRLSTSSVLDGSDDLLQIDSNAIMKYKWHLEPVKDAGGGGDSSSSSGSSKFGGSNFYGGATGTPPGTGLSTPTPTPPAAQMKDMPIYSNILESHPSQMGMVIITNDPMSKAVEFYQKEMSNRGWIDQSMPFDPSSPYVQLTYMKETTITVITFTTNEGKTTIMITQVSQ